MHCENNFRFFILKLKLGFKETTFKIVSVTLMSGYCKWQYRKEQNALNLHFTKIKNVFLYNLPVLIFYSLDFGKGGCFLILRKDASNIADLLVVFTIKNTTKKNVRFLHQVHVKA